MSMEESSSGAMVKLTATNYTLWRPRMEDLLNCKDLFDPIEAKGENPDPSKVAEWKKLNKKTIGQIRQWIDHSVFHHVAKETDAYALWTKLEDMYQAKTARNKALLLKRLVHLTLQSGTSVAEHTSEFQSLVNQLSAVDYQLGDEDQALLLLSSLPDSWETLVVSLSNSAPNGKLTMAMVKDALFNEEARRKDIGMDQSHALVTERGRQQRGGRDRGRGRSKSRGRSTDGRKSSYKCYHCGLEGHMKKNCRKLLREQRLQGNQPKKDGETLVTCTGEVALCSTEEETCLHISTQDVEWVVDTAASYHVTPHRDFFKTYKAGDFGTVKMGNSSFAKIMGTGDIQIKTNVGCTITLKDVRHVPDLRLNLLSGVALDKQGYDNYFSKGTWKMTKGAIVVARGHICGTLYKTHVKICADSLNIAEGEASQNLWHQRLGHMSEKGLSTLARKKLITVCKDAVLDPCNHCLFGKQHRVSFSSSASRKSELLSLVHSDVCGPMEVESLGGNKYFLTFIDDASRKVWVYFLKTKDQVLDYFKLFHTMVERETGKKLKCLRSDNGGEYTSKEFDAYCRRHGIRHEKTVPRTPQHNGIAERMNRTIMEKVRSMLSMAKLPKPFWGEAVRAACYLINRSPSVPLNFEIPEKMWSGKIPSYSHLRVFGCIAYVHVSKELRQKLDARSTPCIFIGYGDEEFGYRLWDPKTKKVIRSRDVVFQENQKMEDIEKPRMSPNYSSSAENFCPNPAPAQIATEDNEVHEDIPEADQEEEGDNEQGETQSSQAAAGPSQRSDDGTPPETSGLQVRRSERGRIPSKRFPESEYILLTEEGEPESFQEAVSHQEKEKWLQAMQDEMESLQKNHTYELVELPTGKKALKNKWVFKLKKDGSGRVVKHKARLVVKGFLQKKGIDFDEIFSPVVKMTSIRVIFGLVASLNLELEQMDVKTAFLHGDLHEEIYMEQPEGFEVSGKENLICKLKKSLYGLKQAPRQWYKKFDSFMVSQGYKRTAADQCVYIQKFSGGNFIALLLYVDDMLIVGQDAMKNSKLKKELSKSFDMKDLGPAQQILGMQIIRDRKNRRLWLSQEKYVERVIKRFNMDKAKPVSIPLANHFKLSKRLCPSSKEEIEEMASVPYSSAVGSLMYAMVCTRPDIAHAVAVVSRFLSNPGKKHWEAVKWILRYLKGTSKLCLCYGGGDPILEGYTDADMAGDPDNRKSTSGYLYTFAGGAVSWQSRLQKCVALSTTEAEYIAAAEAGKEMLWLKRFLTELGIKQEDYKIHCDNQSAMDLSKNSMYHSRTKHIDIRYHWIREVIDQQLLKLIKIHTKENPADMLTKVVAQEKLKLCRDIAGIDGR
ncbi:retrovirus-related Pol polyprotein from transposon TNT 1-94 [Ziziphus jujuba]|uniref:Retrovirus-related Pol polyprotein from transposon TNT 1-94 n=1 Tax=Ziziphus jujuba TaxID=326968 RepID=A0ABM3I9L4_ZIZJJ|nr:retrovirus-related Pol polyprotein from transposon TNT 1-94 [Ziziphus jujuba]